MINGLVKPSCLIIDEVGRCVFDKENTRMLGHICKKNHIIITDYEKIYPISNIIIFCMSVFITLFSAGQSLLRQTYAAPFLHNLQDKEYKT